MQTVSQPNATSVQRQNEIDGRLTVKLQSSKHHLPYREKISDISLYDFVRKFKTVFSCFEEMTEEEMRNTTFRHMVSQHGHEINLAAANEELFVSFTIDVKGGEL